VSHPSLGEPPLNPSAAFPEGAARLRAAESTISARALEVAIERDPTMTTRHDELALRQLLRDAAVYLDRIALAVGTGDDRHMSEWAEMVAPLYRRRRVPMDDLITLGEGLRRAVRIVLSPLEQERADAAIDEAVRELRWNRRIAGDARKRNKLLQLLYKGA
jgi:hypothetical protein